jgi:hypothetical protein
VKGWAACIGLDQSRYGTHSLRRTKGTLIYKRTKNIRAIQLLLGHTKLESTVRYLGMEVDDALEISQSRPRFRPLFPPEAHMVAEVPCAMTTTGARVKESVRLTSSPRSVAP